MKRILVIALLTIAASPFALSQAKNERTGHSSKAKREMTQAERERVGESQKSTSLILQADEGERMVRRWGLSMTIKVDPVNGGSKHLLVGTEDIPPGKAIPVHKHSHCDEVVILLQGRGTAILGEKRQEVTAGAMLFIPEDEWVGLENTGQETIRIVFIFSELGFDKYLRATSVPEGQEVKPFSPKELAEIRQKFKGVITFKDE
jgi:quercetin dioxygenase-like cupin family protein